MGALCCKWRGPNINPEDLPLDGSILIPTSWKSERGLQEEGRLGYQASESTDVPDSTSELGFPDAGCHCRGRSTSELGEATAVMRDATAEAEATERQQEELEASLSRHQANAIAKFAEATSRWQTIREEASFSPLAVSDEAAAVESDRLEEAAAMELERQWEAIAEIAETERRRQNLAVKAEQKCEEDVAEEAAVEWQCLEDLPADAPAAAEKSEDEAAAEAAPAENRYAEEAGSDAAAAEKRCELEAAAEKSGNVEEVIAPAAVGEQKRGKDVADDSAPTAPCPGPQKRRKDVADNSGPTVPCSGPQCSSHPASWP